MLPRVKDALEKTIGVLEVDCATDRQRGHTCITTLVSTFAVGCCRFSFGATMNPLEIPFLPPTPVGLCFSAHVHTYARGSRWFFIARLMPRFMRAQHIHRLYRRFVGGVFETLPIRASRQPVSKSSCNNLLCSLGLVPLWFCFLYSFSCLAAIFCCRISFRCF